MPSSRTSARSRRMGGSSGRMWLGGQQLGGWGSTSVGANASPARGQVLVCGGGPEAGPPQMRSTSSRTLRSRLKWRRSRTLFSSQRCSSSEPPRPSREGDRWRTESRGAPPVAGAAVLVRAGMAFGLAFGLACSKGGAAAQGLRELLSAAIALYSSSVRSAFSAPGGSAARAADGRGRRSPQCWSPCFSRTSSLSLAPSSCRGACCRPLSGPCGVHVPQSSSLSSSASECCCPTSALDAVSMETPDSPSPSSSACESSPTGSSGSGSFSSSCSTVARHCCIGLGWQECCFARLLVSALALQAFAMLPCAAAALQLPCTKSWGWCPCLPVGLLRTGVRERCGVASGHLPSQPTLRNEGSLPSVGAVEGLTVGALGSRVAPPSLAARNLRSEGLHRPPWQGCSSAAAARARAKSVARRRFFLLCPQPTA
mmetsp:Transcript_61366/g.170160  ORF Transcript_61366/g.170160 Transcript_61366/m.170160 type:complete len:427 (-) Transcript_61366:710-1990(-)